MAGPLLATKIHVPRRRRGLVVRQRLNQRLNACAESSLTLVSAPAGFGKTTLLTDWLAAGPADGWSVAWLSLDQRDNDPALFWTYLVEALRTVAPHLGSAALTLLEPPQAPIDAVLATLLNELDAIANDVVLVLDDYHVIVAPEVHDGMAFLLEHLPPQIHLVIASRADPALPLARLRSRGDFVEIRAAELRFTDDETEGYLNDVMALSLTADNVAALESRTEGWIAALQLAALSLQGRGDPTGFIAGFAGDDRYIVDYLAEEVLQRQPEHVQQFLLHTSILDRLSGPLCDAVTGQEDGQNTLVGLERANLFLFSVDDRRRWYRYHQLFADVLQARLLDEQPTVASDLHRRASEWYAQNGERSEAIRHALAGRDFAHAADLVELAIPELSRSRQEVTLLGWLAALPDHVVEVRPVLSVGYAGAILLGGGTDGVETRLRDAERWLIPATGAGHGPAPPAEEMIVVDDGEFLRLPGMIEVYRAALALARGDVPSTVGHAERALELAPADDHLGRAAAAGLSGLAFWSSGDLEAGYSAYADCLAGLRRANYIADTFGCAIALADIRVAQGRLGEAMRIYEQTLQLAHQDEVPVLRGTADMYVGMSQIHREHDNLPAAAEALRRSQELGEQAGLPQNPYRWRVAMSGIKVAEGDLAGALDLLDEAQRRYVGDYFPPVRPISALRARVLLGQGELAAALSWVRDLDLSADDALSYLHEFKHLTLARVLLAQHTRATSFAHDAIRLLDRLLRAAETGRRTGSMIEILALRALGQQAVGDVAAGLASLQHALALAEPEGYVRIFVDEGPPMATLLRAAARHQIADGYVRRLLDGCGQAAANPSARQGLVEPLSERELEVLRLLGTDLDGPEIARQLIVSLNTLRTHTKNIYAKLGVNNRRAAVRRARELGLSLRG
jgi:LuxR family maltose regulon positive regulatory protein